MNVFLGLFIQTCFLGGVAALQEVVDNLDIKLEKLTNDVICYLAYETVGKHVNISVVHLKNLRTLGVKKMLSLFFINTSFHAWIEHTRVLYLEIMFCKVVILFLNYCRFLLEVSSFVVISKPLCRHMSSFRKPWCRHATLPQNIHTSEGKRQWSEERNQNLTNPFFFLQWFA